MKTAYIIHFANSSETLKICTGSTLSVLHNFQDQNTENTLSKDLLEVNTAKQNVKMGGLENVWV